MSQGRLGNDSTFDVDKQISSTRHETTIADTNRYQIDTGRQSGKPGLHEWNEAYERYSPDQSVFYRTNASQGWKNFGTTLDSAQKKRFNNMKSGMGSSMSGVSAETKMMRVVCENKEVMDQYNQMQARIKRLNKD